jgi:hypothetical protein
MRTLMISSAVMVGLLSAPLGAQRRGAAPPAPAGRVTFAVSVTDPAGAPVPDVKVSVTGAAERSGRTEAGRMVFEAMPAGSYRFRFDKDGFVPLERELAARGTAPVDVKVTLTPAPPPPTPPAPAKPSTPPAVNARLVVLDMPAYIEKYYVGKTASKANELACATGGASSLMQLNEPLVEHTHADADEFIYVIAGQGMATIGTRQEPLGPGVFMLIPRGTAHAIGVGAKKPLEFISTRAGERCGAAADAR